MDPNVRIVRPDDPYDIVGFIHQWLDWSGGPLRDMAELWTELIGNRDQISYLGAPSLNALRHSFPFASDRDLRSPSGPLLRDAESISTWSIFTANIWMRLFADDEFVRYEAGRNFSDDTVDTWTRATRRFFKLPGHQHVLYKMCGDLSTFGIGWCESTVGTQKQVRFSPSIRDMGEGVGDLDFVPRMQTWLDHKLEHIHPFDFYPDWSAPPGPEMSGGVVVGRSTVDRMRTFLRKYEELGWKNGEGYNKEAFEKAVANNDKEFHFNSGSRGERWRTLTLRGLSEEDIKLPARFRPLMYYKFRGEVPWGPVTNPKGPASDEDALEAFRLLIVINDQPILNVPQPYYPHPFRCLQLGPMTDRLIPVSPLERIRYEQDELDTWRNLRTRAGLKTIQSPTLYESTAFDDPSVLDQPSSDQNIAVRPGYDITKVTHQIPYNFAPIFTVAQMINDGKQWTREGVGLPDIIRGIAAGARTTKREIDELSVTGNLPMDVQTDLLENEDLPHMARDVGLHTILALRDLRDVEDGLPAYDAELQDRLGSDRAMLQHMERPPDMFFEGGARFRAWHNLPAISNIIFSFVQMFPETASAIVPQLVSKLLNAASPGASMRFLEEAIAMGTGAGSALRNATAMQGGAKQPGQPSQPRIRAVS